MLLKKASITLATAKPSTIFRVLATTIVVALVAVVVAVFVLLNRDPAILARHDAEKDLYAQIAYNAAILQGRVDSPNMTFEKLHKPLDDNPYLNGTADDGTASADQNSVSWVSQISSKAESRVFISGSTAHLTACVRYTAHLNSHTVDVDPINCSEAKASSSFTLTSDYPGTEVQLAKAEIDKARNARPRHLECQAIGEGRSVCK